MPLKDKTLNTINRKDHYLRPRPSSSTKNSISKTYPDSSESVASALAKFFCIYNPRLMTSCDFFIWRTHNQICLPVKDRQEEVNLFSNFLRKYRHEWSEEEINNIKKLEKDCDTAKFFQLRLVDPRAFVDWCENEYNTTLEQKKLLPNKLVEGDIKRQETFKIYMYLQTNPSKWIINHNKESIDIGRAFARTIVWDEIKMLEYDNPILSFIIDLTQPQKNFLHAISSPIFEEVIRIPEHYLKKPSQTFEELFNKFYLDNKRWRYDDFGSEGAGLLASEFRKEANSRKPDFWVLMEVDNTIQEILYKENSGGPFVNDPKKFKSDLYKLFRLGRDSKQKLEAQLINNNLQFLLDYESLYEKLCMIELFLIQAYETNLRICIMDQPAPPLCRVRELFNIPIPYKLPVDRISVLYILFTIFGKFI
ncbi:1390_t:CDS:2 [Cetraspora pellucida]|uniref:1390_t:CDS:1 n=1 Tax=Cetraspora pellucida TaxID=1433469 RepID=A0A9N8ZDE5_9GLOM|nr:1390_t:CDS:2 [Cetraspora pellucida]